MDIRTLIFKVLIKITRSLRFMLNDEVFLRILYRIHMRKQLNLSSPQTMNEKMQWLKLHDRQPIYQTMVDKLAAKEYYGKMLGTEYIVPTIGVWNRVEDIDFDSLPNKFVLKTNHSGGNTGVIVCKDKSRLDIASAKRRLKKSLKSDIYKGFAEWPYKGINKRIFAEELLGKEGEELVDYKFYCFDGYVDAVLIPQILHRKRMRRPPVRACLRQTAAIGALAAIAATVFLHGRIEAQTGNRVAQCTVDEAF